MARTSRFFAASVALSHTQVASYVLAFLLIYASLHASTSGVSLVGIHSTTISLSSRTLSCVAGRCGVARSCSLSLSFSFSLDF